MATRKKVRVRAKAAAADDDQPVDVVRIGQGVGTFETVNGMPQGIVTAVLVVIGVILIRPISRALRALLRR
jgi:hypothetical protein